MEFFVKCFKMMYCNNNNNTHKVKKLFNFYSDFLNPSLHFPN